MSRKRAKDDCLRQCVARVTGRKPHRVPHFVKKYRGRWIYHLSEWCRRTGHIMILAPTRQRAFVHIFGDFPHIRIGLTKIKKTCHAVVYEADGTCSYDGGNPLGKVDRVLVIVKRDSNGKAKPGRSACVCPRNAD